MLNIPDNYLGFPVIRLQAPADCTVFHSPSSYPSVSVEGRVNDGGTDAANEMWPLFYYDANGDITVDGWKAVVPEDEWILQQIYDATSGLSRDAYRVYLVTCEESPLAVTVVVTNLSYKLVKTPALDAERHL